MANRYRVFSKDKALRHIDNETARGNQGKWLGRLGGGAYSYLKLSEKFPGKLGKIIVVPGTIAGALIGGSVGKYIGEELGGMGV